MRGLIITFLLVIAAWAKPAAAAPCDNPLKQCGTDGVSCGAFALGVTDLPNPDPTLPTPATVTMPQWAKLCRAYYVGKKLNNDAVRAADDPVASALSIVAGYASSGGFPDHIFALVVVNSTGSAIDARVDFEGTTTPISPYDCGGGGGPRFFDAWNATQYKLLPTGAYMDSCKTAIISALQSNGSGLQQVMIHVEANAYKVELVSPKDINNPKAGYYAAGAFTADATGQVAIDPSTILGLTAYRRVIPYCSAIPTPVCVPRPAHNPTDASAIATGR